MKKDVLIEVKSVIKVVVPGNESISSDVNLAGFKSSKDIPLQVVAPS